MKQDGKTLAELMVVAGILAMVALMGIPNYLGLNSRNQLRCVTEEIASDLRLARQLALTNRDRVRIVIDTEQQELITQLVDGNTTHHVYPYRGRVSPLKNRARGGTSSSSQAVAQPLRQR